MKPNWMDSKYNTDWKFNNSHAFNLYKKNIFLMENIFFLQIENLAIDEHTRYIQCNEFRVYRKCYTVQ